MPFLHERAVLAIPHFGERGSDVGGQLFQEWPQLVQQHQRAAVGDAQGGDLIGERALLKRSPWPATYRAKSATKVLALTREALEEALLGIQIDDEVELRVIDRGVGGITETNVNLASASDAIIIGFNVRAEGKATELANREGVEIRYYSVIYQAIDEIESALKGMLKPIYEERELGRAEIRAIFRSSKVGNIAGCLVQSGTMRRNAKARLLRDNVVVAENLTVSSLKREKDDATEVREGYECGLTVTYADIKEGDVIETYELVEKARV